ncbi:MAG: FUSC family protein, partial [Gaiellales bacterium]
MARHPLTAPNIRQRTREAAARLRASARPLIQASLAAPLAWLIATKLFGHEQPIFAPISALVTIGATVALPWQRAVEIVLGVALGVGIADVLSSVIGQGTWQIGVIVLLAMSTAVLLAGRPSLVLQAGTAAALVASLPSADGAASLARVLDSLSGGTAALLFSVLILPVRPLRIAHRAAAPVLEELAQTFEQIGEALRRSDPPLAQLALMRARRAGDHWARLNEVIGIGRQAARIAPVRRHEEPELLDMAASVVQLDYAIRDARVLARVALRMTETQVRGGARLELAMREFAATVRSLDGHLAGEYDESLAVRDASTLAVRLACSIKSPD